ncbi:hypothetical protein [Actinomadura rupiterrae]|uniref:hypothetical protein n=1 Tax=Actinomadura rupiterrae TaxID=559627 RepID=UPI0020A28520|nr:hypothetical protein [Actinomadura rupiterrae]MCP2340689.1 preprotein translocase subunit SecA [Actinomadura rupiterrae]
MMVDEAMVPLVLAGAVDSAGADPSYADLVRRLRPGRDDGTDTKARDVQFTAEGAREGLASKRGHPVHPLMAPIGKCRAGLAR